MLQYYAQEEKPPQPEPPPPQPAPEPNHEPEPLSDPDARELPEHVEPDEPWPR